MARNTSTETTAPKVTRVRKTPAEKAQAALDTAQKRYDKAVAKRTRILDEVGASNNEVRQAERFLDFAKGDPDLPVQEAIVGEAEVQTTDQLELQPV